MDMSLEEYFDLYRPEQCPIGTRWLLGRMRELRPKVYMEIGCAHLATFKLYEDLLPPAPDGFALGLDVRDYKEWPDYSSSSGCDFKFIAENSASDEALELVKEALGGREIDYLFIDGNHYVDYVVKDWENYSPLVRSGGLVAIHDLDFDALDRGEVDGQGGAFVTRRLINGGLKVEFPPYTTVGTSLITAP